MNTKWLEDFIALVDCGSFTRAAQSRHVTQPAFSRRIRALENWLGVELISRNTYPLCLTPAGREYLQRTRALLADIHQLRTDIRGWASPDPRIVVATQHSLSLSYCPGWYRRCRPFLGERSFCINAMNLYECIEAFLQNQCDLLLCYVTERVVTLLEDTGIERIRLGTESLLPVCAVDANGRPQVDATRDTRLPLIGFPAESFLGELIFTECIPEAPPGVAFDVIYETALSEGVRTMTLNQAGMAWLPAGLVESELDDGTLTRVPGLQDYHLQIALFRHARVSDPAVSAIWDDLDRHTAAVA